MDLIKAFLLYSLGVMSCFAFLIIYKLISDNKTIEERDINEE